MGIYYTSIIFIFVFLLTIVFIFSIDRLKSLFTSSSKGSLQSEVHKVKNTPIETPFDRNFKMIKERFLQVQTTLERLCCEHVNENDNTIDFRELKHKVCKLYQGYEGLNRAYDKCKDAAQELNSANENLDFYQKRMFDMEWDFRETHSMFDDNCTTAKIFHEIDMESIQNDINRAYHIEYEREKIYSRLLYEYEILYVSFSDTLTSMEEDIERLPCVDDNKIINKCPNIITQIES